MMEGQHKEWKILFEAYEFHYREWVERYLDGFPDEQAAMKDFHAMKDCPFFRNVRLLHRTATGWAEGEE